MLENIIKAENIFNVIKDSPLEDPTGKIYGMGYLDNVGAMQIGRGSDVFRGDKSGIWLGAKKWADAPFRVDMDGNVVASTVVLEADVEKIYFNSGKDAYIEYLGPGSGGLIIYSGCGQMRIGCAAGPPYLIWGEIGYENDIRIIGGSSVRITNANLRVTNDIYADDLWVDDINATDIALSGYVYIGNDYGIHQDNGNLLVEKSGGDAVLKVDDEVYATSVLRTGHYLYLNDATVRHSIYVSSVDHNLVIQARDGYDCEIMCIDGGDIYLWDKTVIYGNVDCYDKIRTDDGCHLDENPSAWGTEPNDSLTLHGYAGSGWGKSSGWATWGCNYSEIEKVSGEFLVPEDNLDKEAEKHVSSIFEKRAKVWRENMAGRVLAVRNKKKEDDKGVKRVLTADKKEIIKQLRSSNKSSDDLLTIADYEIAVDPDEEHAKHFESRSKDPRLNKDIIREVIEKKRVSTLQEGTLLQMTEDGARPTDKKGQTNLLGVVSEDDGFTTGVDKEGIRVCKSGSSHCFVKGPCAVGDLLIASNSEGTAISSGANPAIGSVIGRAKENKSNNSIKLISVDVAMM